MGRAAWGAAAGAAALVVWALPGTSAAQDVPGVRDREIVLATTTSIRDSGLLAALLPGFEGSSGYRVKVIAVGSGQALALARGGECDLLVVHDPDGEAALVRDGFARGRVPLMSNGFVLVGPAEDPADVRGLDPVEALQRLARAGELFVSRADRSGTHTRERALWRRAGIVPAAAWYRETGQGMSATLQIANELRAYALTDVGTFLAHGSPLDLRILVEGGAALFNPYHVLVVDPMRFPDLNAHGARELVRFLTAPQTQRAIGEYRRDEFGRPLFVPAQGDTGLRGAHQPAG